MKICSECREVLNRISINNKIVYFHPPNVCKHSEDGIRISAEIIDEFMLETFQKSIIDSPEHPEQQIMSQISPILKESNLDKIKVRLADGNLNWHEFDCIKQRLDIKDD